jgi:predicted ATPase
MSSSILVICAFREENLDNTVQMTQETSPSRSNSFLTDFLQHVTASVLINTTQISLRNLDEEMTSQLVAEYLRTKPEISDKMGSIIFEKSHGNPFHALQLLGPLMFVNKIPRYKNQPSMKPQDGDDSSNAIFKMAEVAPTVDELLCQRFSLLSKVGQHVLQVAACMGDSIDLQAVCTVFDGNLADVEKSLQIASVHGFLTLDVLDQYRFTHDRVRQAVLSATEDVNGMSFQVGYQLWKKSSPMFLTHQMFLVTNLLNHGTNLLEGQAERYKAAAINLEAGSHAMSLSAFQDAARFLNSGIEFLNGGDYWNDEYELALNLFSAAADAELCNQNFDSVTALVEVVFLEARTLKDKLRAYIVHINSLGQRGNVEAATQVGINVMRQLGEPLPPKVTNTTILLEIMKTKIALRGRSNETLLRLPPLQDDKKLACVYVLTNLMPYAFQASSNYITVIGARLVRLCLRYGMHKWCATGFSIFAFVLCTFNRKEGCRLGMLALAIIEKYGGRELLPRVHMNFFALVNHWIHPLKTSLKPLELASKVGMEVGDVEYAMLALSTHATYSLYNGKPLLNVKTMFDDVIQRMRLLREDGLLVLVGMSQQFVQILTGELPLDRLLSDAVSPLQERSSEADSQLIPYSYYFMVAELAFLFGDLEIAAKMLTKNQSLRFEPIGTYLFAKVRFIEALICVNLARCNGHGKRENLGIAKGDLKQLTAWTKDCPSNFLHKQQLVEAEIMSLRVHQKSSTLEKLRVKELYDVAITNGLKEGFLHEAALANELAGNFMDRQHDRVVARRYWTEAYNLYLQWGATEKVKHLSARTGAG